MANELNLENKKNRKQEKKIIRERTGLTKRSII